jgi:2-polyprenyl-3-methyl-5-hydroxy-6-metoxy-1,4-benzoquinol methylase|tara:strand:- start:654 stop:1337 length:684 start_codon:yes stop_codon:yes gene_type:complete
MNYSGWELNFFDKSKNFRNYQFSLIKKYLKNKILEIGPGNGTMVDQYISKYFSDISVSEIDKKLNKKLVKTFKNKKNVKIYKKKINEFKNKFNSIIYSDVIEHIKDDKKEIKFALKRLNKNGHLIIMVPAFQYLYSEYDKSIGHYRRYKKSFFVNFAKKNKIKLVKILYFDSIGFMFLLLGKLINTKNKKSVGLGAFIWNLLVPLSRVIDKVIAHSVGKSVLCVYRK